MDPFFLPPQFPYLDLNEGFPFPHYSKSSPEGILVVGGNTSPGMLLSAYSQGIFPWYSPGQPILWWSPDPRFVLFPGELHIPKRMKRSMGQRPFRVTMDMDFRGVIRSCAETPRQHETGTWITEEMIEGYIRFHELGYAHSVEAWSEEELVGGVYGVSLGRCFFGESMFTRKSNASKIALFTLVEVLENEGFHIVDCQVYTENLERFGARDISRPRFYEHFAVGMQGETLRGKWNYNFETKRISIGR